MPIVPDTKDWTWVLERPCPECGFEPGAASFRDIPRLTRENVAAWERVLRGDRAELILRPDDATWSPLEYAAHVRDLCRIMLARLNLMLVLDDPAFVNWDQDETQQQRDYNAQDPATVARELAAAGQAIATAFELVAESDEQRTGRRGDGSTFTATTLASYFLHDISHHIWDVTGR